MSTDFYQFELPTKILFQPGICRNFANELEQIPAKKFFFILDPYFFEQGLYREIQKVVEEAGGSVSGIFHDIPPNSELKVVQACAEQARRSHSEAILVVGGGSAMDTAKAANILLSLGGDLVKDYSGSQTLPHPLRPLIAIPSTAGTGSEVTGAAVILDAVGHRKVSFSDAYLKPTLALLDPELTLTVPPALTAMNGMDALTHSIEAYTSIQANPMSDAMAMKAVKLIKNNLLSAVKNGSDLEARSGMLIAANMAGIAFDHAMVGVVHSVSHAVGGVAGVPHGLANSIFLPYGMEYNMESCQDRYAGMARRFGLDTRGMNSKQAGRAAVDFIRHLQSDLKEACSLPNRFRDVNVQEDQLESIALLAVEEGTSFYNPREVTAEEILKKIREAY